MAGAGCRRARATRAPRLALIGARTVLESRVGVAHVAAAPARLAPLASPKWIEDLAPTALCSLLMYCSIER